MLKSPALLESEAPDLHFRAMKEKVSFHAKKEKVQKMNHLIL